MNRPKRVPISVFVLALSSSPLAAGYIVDGKIQGTLCTSYIVFSSCRPVPIDAVQEGDGQPVPIKDEFNNVDDYSNGHCWISLKGSWGALSWAMRKAWGPTFFTKKPDGEYEKVDPDYLTFKCSKQN